MPGPYQKVIAVDAVGNKHNITKHYDLLFDAGKVLVNSRDAEVSQEKGWKLLRKAFQR